MNNHRILTILAALAAVAAVAAGCGGSAPQSAVTVASAAPTSPTPSPSPTYREIAWMNETATTGAAFSKPFTVSGAPLRLEWWAEENGLGYPNGIGVYMQKPNALSFGRRLVDTNKPGSGKRGLSLAAGRYELAVDAGPGTAFKVRLSELTSNP